jgi:2-polyprenyl-3-methyl-5-hydroxy-6-metoxy-1,4-benzoquinol methylase
MKSASTLHQAGRCRFCETPLVHSFVDLGMSPLSNAFIKPENYHAMEPFYPLHAYVCGSCFLVQLEEFESPQQIFSDYAYFSSYSESWLQHAKAYTELMIRRFGFNASHQVIEIASNDGYLLRNFKEHGIPVLGIEPAENVAQTARAAGIPTQAKFFGVKTARELAASGQQADLLLGNNVLAHVPDVNDFVAGMKIALKRDGVLTMEFPHLMQLMAHNQFDTIYHEHFSYFSFVTVEKIFAKHGLTLFDVEELPTHGGSLRIYARHVEYDKPAESANVESLRKQEIGAGITALATYEKFSENVRETKRKLLDFLIRAKREGKTLAGYGAPAKGNTLLNYCGIRTDFLDYTVDRSPHKQGLFLPGTRIPVHAPDRIRQTRPDYILILPWNIKDEIIEQMSHVREWGGKFVVPIPRVEVIA